MKKTLYTLLILSLHSVLYGQINAPLSAYGPGMLYSGSNVAAMGRGYTGVTFNESNTTLLNFQNPASYSKLHYTCFDASVIGISGGPNNGSIKQSGFTMQPAHLALGLSLINKNNYQPQNDKFRMGASAGLLPYSKVAYYLQGTQTNSAGTQNVFYKGDGNWYQAYVGTGLSWKGLSFGAQVAHYFGNINYRTSIYWPDSIYALGTRLYENYHPNGWQLTVGGQYALKINPKNSLEIAGTYTGMRAISLRYQTVYERFNHSGAAVDSIGSTNDQQTTMTLPTAYAAGLSWSHGTKWMIAANYRFTQWSVFSLANRNQNLKNTALYSIGGSFIPDETSLQFLSRCTYRVGAYYGDDFISNNAALKGLTLGMGMKFFSSNLSTYKLPFYLNLGLDLGSRGSLTNGALQENFTRFQFGISLTEEWFQRRKFD